MKIKKRYFLLAIVSLLVVLLIPLLNTDAVEGKLTDGFVVNTHRLLPQRTIDSLNEILVDLEEVTGVEMVIVAMRVLPEHQSPRAYADTLFQHMGLGKDELNNGVLILLTESEQDISIAVGAGLKEALPENYLKKIQGKHLVSYFKKGFWDDGLVSGVQAISKHLKESSQYISKEVAKANETDSLYNWEPTVAIQNLELGMTVSGKQESKRYLLYLFLTVVIVNVAVHMGIRLRLAKYPIYQSQGPTAIYLYKFLMIRTALCLVVVPLFPVMLFWNLKALKRVREAKVCTHCHKHTLEEVPIDATKAHKNNTTEREVILGSVVIKHFKCSACHQVEVVKYPLKKENVEQCPLCLNYTLKAGELKINEEPTYISKGIAQTPYTCLHCGKEFLVYDDVPKLSMDTSSK